jgi:hypothetical protein
MLPLVHWYFRWAPHPGSQLLPNAALQARGIAGARHERTLFPVALQAFVRRCFGPGGMRLIPVRPWFF